mmetsp:Transcript_15452/g.25036  ORF Transcript_15452/g.25036 Transcript_15452/m.25036 type:complete len:268 (+) Transcript_15452:198-1001(+)
MMNVQSTQTSRCSIMFRRQYNVIHHLDGFVRVFTFGSLSTCHYRISTIIHGISHIGYFGSSGTRILCHRFQHLGRHNHGFSYCITGCDHFLLSICDLLNGDFHSKVSAGNHNAIRFFENFVEMFQSGGTFDLGNDEWERTVIFPTQFLGTLFHVVSNFSHTFCSLNKGCSNIINVDFQSIFDIFFVLLRHCWQVSFCHGQVDASSGTQFTRVINATHHSSICVIDLRDSKNDSAVIQEHLHSRTHALVQFAVIDKEILICGFLRICF